MEFDLSKEEAIPPPPPAQSLSPTAALSLPAAISASAAIRDAPAYLPKPPLVSAEAGNRSVQLGWYPSEGQHPISGYLIYRGTEPARLGKKPINRKPVSAPEFLDSAETSLSGPENRLTYYYGVRAVDEDGRMSPMSDIVSAVPNGPLLPPGKFAADQRDGGVVLQWSPAISSGTYDLSAYLLYRSQESGNYAAPYQVLPLSPTSFTDPVPNGKPYFYHLRSLDAAGNTSEASPEIKASAYKAVKPPDKLVVRGVGDQSILLRWQASEGKGTYDVAGYNVYRSTNLPVDLGARPVNKAPVTGTKFEDEAENSTDPPKLATTYHYMVVALDSQGNPSPPTGPVSGSPTASVTGFKISEQEIPGTGGSTLSIQGKKTIVLGYNNVWPLSGQQATNSGLAITQQLRVNLTGKVGRKIKVDVDYDDQVQNSDTQKISVVYTGDQQEVFKEFAFGDVLMDLGTGRTEWAGYNKHLFGAKVKLASPDDKFRLTAIGAQTKGFTETKRILGGLEQAKTGNVLGRDFLDTSVQLYRYYYLSRDKDLIEGRAFIKPGTVDIYYDQYGVTTLTNNTLKAVPDAGPNGGQFSFRHLVPGQDYTVDNSTGLITFNGTVYITGNDSIAVAYTLVDAAGVEHEVGHSGGVFDFTPANLRSDRLSGKTSPTQHLIQYGKEATLYDSHMSFQFYNLGNRDILNPQLDPDFKMVVYGTDQKSVYELNNRSDFSDVVEFDTRLGTMKFRVPFPFKSTLSATRNLAMDLGTFNLLEEPFPGDNEPATKDVYFRGSPAHNFIIHVEYKYKVPNYSLRPGIIRGSEVITLDGKKLIRDTDYFLDYESGFLSFQNPDLIKSDSIIDATYEYLPFGGQFTSTIWGVRGEYDLASNLQVGSTFLMNSSDAPLETPEIRSTPFGLSLLDADAQFGLSREKISDMLGGLTGKASLPVAAQIRTELARSTYSPNTFNQHNETGVAMIDSFESVDNVVSMSVDENAWSPSSRPVTSGFPQGLPMDDRQFSKVVNETQQAHDYLQRAANENPNRSMLAIHYGGMDTAGKWDSFVTPFSSSQNGLADYDYLEMWVKADSPITLNMDLGQVNEDANANGLLDAESTGVFIKAQDLGTWTSAMACPPSLICYPYPPSTDSGGRYQDKNYWGADNNVVDTEDLNHDGVINPTESFYRLGQRILQPNTWTQIRVRLKDAELFDSSNLRSTVPGNQYFYTNLQALRMWWTGAAASGGTILVESIQFKGNKWQTRADPAASAFGSAVSPDTDKLQAAAINSLTSSSVAPGYNYQPNVDFFRVQVDADRAREQALQFQYKLTNLDQTLGKPNFMARRVLTTGATIDFGNYQNIRLDLYKPADLLPGEILLLRLGVDDFNYFEYRILMDGVPRDGAWHTQTFALDGSDGKRTTTGQPYLRSIKFVALAILTNNSSTNSDPSLPGGREFFWVDNLRVTDAQTRAGTAYKVNVTYDLAGLPVTERYVEMDSDFVMMDRQDIPPSRHSQVHTLASNFEPIKGVPVTATWETQKLATESKRREDPAYNRTFIDPDHESQLIDATMGFTKIPKLSVNTHWSWEADRDHYLPTYVTNQRQLMQDFDLQPNNESDKVHFNQNYQLTMPDFVPVLKSDQLSFVMAWDEYNMRFNQETKAPEVPNFKNVHTRTASFQTRYTGQYKPFSALSISPSYGVSQSFASGNIQQPVVKVPYYTLLSRTTDTDNDNPIFKSLGDNFVPQYMEFNPGLLVQLDKLPFVRQPRISYNFKQTWDYIAYEVRTPGSLDLNATLAPADLFPGGLPEFTFAQQWAVDSTVNSNRRDRLSTRQSAQAMRAYMDAHPEFAQRYGSGPDNYNNVPNPVWLERQMDDGSPLDSVWWVRAGENLDDPFNIENVASNASKRSTTNLSTAFELALLPGWKGNFKPRAQYGNARTMSQPEQVTYQHQWSFGAGWDVNEPAIPFSSWYNPGLLQINYDFQNTDNDDAGGNHSSNSQSHDWRFQLPRKATESWAVNLSCHLRTAKDTSFVGTTDTAGIQSFKNNLEPQMTANYVLRVDKTMKMWDFWPFSGRELKIKQSFELYNTLSLLAYSETRPTIKDGDIATNRYELLNRVKYNVLENVEVNLTLQNQWNVNKGGLPSDTYLLGVSAGVAATF